MLDTEKETAFLLKHIERLSPEELHEELLEAGLEVYSQSENFLDDVEISCDFHTQQKRTDTGLLQYGEAREVNMVTDRYDDSNSNPAA